jgi:hypothetical protein
MNKIQIGSVERNLQDADPNWVNEQINGLRRDGKAVCVRIFFKDEGVDLMMATPGCISSGGGGGRRLTPKEQSILELWDKLHLSKQEFSAGNVVAFLKQLRK